jgi:hypothetical protein
MGDQAELIIVPDEDGNVECPGQTGCALDNGIDYGLDVRGGTRDDT